VGLMEHMKQLVMLLTNIMSGRLMMENRSTGLTMRFKETLGLLLEIIEQLLPQIVELNGVTPLL